MGMGFENLMAFFWRQTTPSGLSRGLTTILFSRFTLDPLVSVGLSETSRCRGAESHPRRGSPLFCTAFCTVNFLVLLAIRMVDPILVRRKECSTPLLPPCLPEYPIALSSISFPFRGLVVFTPPFLATCIASPLLFLPPLHSISELLTAPQLNNKQMTSKAATAAAALNSHQLASFHDPAHKLIDHYKLNTIKSQFSFQPADSYYFHGNKPQQYFFPFFPFSDLQRFISPSSLHFNLWNTAIKIDISIF